jgi:hypothetical protein
MEGFYREWTPSPILGQSLTPIRLPLPLPPWRDFTGSCWCHCYVVVVGSPQRTPRKKVAPVLVLLLMIMIYQAAN